MTLAKLSAIHLLLLSSLLIAQFDYDSPYNYSTWNHELSVLAGIAEHEGRILLQGQELAMRWDPEALMQPLNASMHVKYEGRYDWWLLAASGMASAYTNWQENDPWNNVLLAVDATIGFMPCWDRLYLLVGGRLYYTPIKMMNEADPSITHEITSRWIEPVVGARYEILLTDRFKARLRGDVGGLEHSSNFSGNAELLLR